MQFLMLVCRDTEPVDTSVELGDVEQWVTEMDGSGRRLAGDRLAPQDQARVVRVRGGRTLVTDGPFLETKEILGGFDLLDCKDMDEAIEIAAAHPYAALGVMELRPILAFD
jgi:hypothetical protein